jgi:hypothetical protein
MTNQELAKLLKDKNREVSIRVPNEDFKNCCIDIDKDYFDRLNEEN